MAENTGNSYRTRNAVTACIILMAVAAAILVYGLYGTGLVITAGILLLIVGVAITAMSATYSPEPDKFGPSERNYRLIVGLLITIVGLIVIMAGFNVSAYVYVAILIFGIAVIGLCATALGNKSSKY